jgi:hypothetical protein
VWFTIGCIRTTTSSSRGAVSAEELAELGELESELQAESHRRQRSLHAILPGPYSPFTPPNASTPTSDWSSPGALASHRFDGDMEASAGGYYLWPTSPVTSWRDWNRGLYAPPESSGDVGAGGGPPASSIPREPWLNTSSDPALYSLRRLVLGVMTDGLPRLRPGRSLASLAPW